ncbi:SusC/RagA family TonB-linked outer membrane protein [Runella sp.]|uniref:SusC/RagA family TonB-linked outer membrane protein n=1 Tax=Runella sp. TaxID=1960881 RepID=UPI00301B06A4
MKQNFTVHPKFLPLLRQAISLLTFVLLLSSSAAFAQNRAVKGKVTSADGAGFPGVNVILRGTTTGTSTNGTGEYAINIPNNDAVLVFSFVGFKSQEIKVGSQSDINLTLVEDLQQLQEVVVTALGIKKEVKRLGYTIQEVKGSDLIKARDSNPINSLAGKIAGLSVGASAEMLGRPELVLRGSKDLLFVVDGVPVNSDTWNISPDDIETYSVLKGPNAAALYGSRGINGAIVITTKKGSKEQKGWQADFNSSTMFEKGFIATPEAQMEYGRGSNFQYDFNNGIKNGNGLYDWGQRLPEFGPRFEGQPIRQYDSPYDVATGVRTPTPWLARGTKNFEKFVQTGIISTNNLSVSASGSNYNVRMSYTHMYQKGMFPNTKLNSDNMNLSASYNLSSKLSLEGNINFNHQYSPNIPDVSYGPNSYIYMFKVYGSADYDIDDLKDIYKSPSGVNNLQQYAPEYGRLNSAWFMAKKWLRSHDKTDIYGYLKLNYAISKDLNLSFRSQITTWNQKRTEQVPASANLQAYTPWWSFGWYGDYREDNRNLFENNTDLLLTYNKRVNNSWSLSALAGGNIRTFKYTSDWATTKSLIVPNVYSLSNSINPALVYNWGSEMKVSSAFYSVDLSYKNFLNLSHTGRVDHISTLPSGQQTYYYPSVSLSSVVSDYVDLPSFLSFFKIRASAADVKGALTQATVGSAYQQYTGISTGNLLGYGSDLISSYDGPSYANQNTATPATYYNGTPSISYSNTLADPNLKPFNRVSYEAGIDMKFLSNRLGLDVTYFTTDNGPQIYPRLLAPSTTYTAQNINGITTKRSGFEIALSGAPIKNPEGFNWEVLTNFATFKETLKSIYGTETNLFLNNHNYKIGDRLDEIYGTKFVRDPSGNIIYNGGVPLQSPTDIGNLASLGFLNPNFTFGINNKFSYKNLNFSFQFDGRIGGVMYDYNFYAAMQGGTDLSTVQGVLGEARLKEWQSTKNGTVAPTAALIGNEFGPGVVIASGTPKYAGGQITNMNELTFAPNTTATTVQNYLATGLKARFDEYFMVSRSFAKLREITIGYTLPASVLRGSFVKRATISIVGRNLLYFAQRKDFDLDQYASGFNSSDRSTGGAASNGALQSTTARRFGFNINLGF